MNRILENLAQITKIGFIRVGEWVEKEGCIFPQLQNQIEHKDALYAFVIDDIIKYIGKTSRFLEQRLKMYRKPTTRQRTNIRNNNYIKEAIAEGKKIHIYALSNHIIKDFPKEYYGLYLSLPAALEDSLINTLKPSWNIRGYKI